jgi:3-polyprenyl-4-hydroxybenzoate decarboxylase
VAAAGPAEAHATHDGAADFIIVTDAHAGARPDDWRAPFFFLASNADFTRDAHTAGNRIAFDATRKVPGAGRGGLPVREYPPLVEMDAATAAMVDRRWNEYGFAGARVPTRGACP